MGASVEYKFNLRRIWEKNSNLGKNLFHTGFSVAYIIVLIFHFFVFRELKELRCQMPLTFMSMVQLGRYKSSLSLFTLASLLLRSDARVFILA